jgi:hypothetical protein
VALWSVCSSHEKEFRGRLCFQRGKGRGKGTWEALANACMCVLMEEAAPRCMQINSCVGVFQSKILSPQRCMRFIGMRVKNYAHQNGREGVVSRWSRYGEFVGANMEILLQGWRDLSDVGSEDVVGAERPSSNTSWQCSSKEGRVKWTGISGNHHDLDKPRNISFFFQ